MNRIFYCLLALSALILWPSEAMTQVGTSGRIFGTVEDPTGGRVPGAEVRLEDEATKDVQNTVSIEDGTFVFPNLKVGTYRLTVSAVGFKTVVYSAIRVEAGRSSAVPVKLELGEVTTTLEVIGGQAILETISTAIEKNVTGDLLRSLPLNNRDTLDFVMLLPGAQLGGTARQSTFLGLPKGAINITMDGVNVQDNLLKSAFGGGMFTTVRPRLDAVEEVNVSSAAAGANVGGEGAIQIQFVTRRGTDDYRGTLFWDHRNDALNANNWFNNARGLKRPRNLMNVFGGNVGGPIIKHKIFFFVNYEEFRLPESRSRENLILTKEAATGVFRYRGTDGVERTANLLTIAGGAGFPSTIDPTVSSMLNAIDGARAAVPAGAITSFDLFRERYRFEAPSLQIRRFPTIRLDYHITDKLHWHGIWHYQYFSSMPDTLNNMDPTFPGLGKPAGQYSNRFSLTSALQWRISPRMNNEFRFGLQGAPISFFPESGPEIYPAGVRVMWPLSLQSLHARPALSGTSRSLPSVRNTPAYTVQDNLTWIRGKHTWNFGGQLSILAAGDRSFVGAGVPSISFDVVAGDPVSTPLSATNMPGIGSTDLTNARTLYALLTGRISSISGTRNVNAETKKYEHLAPLHRKEKGAELGLYFTDTWRALSSLTINYGLRWQFQGAMHNPNGIYTSPSFTDLWGVSGPGNLFKPGILAGNATPVIGLRSGEIYKRDFKNPAPSFGMAWNPKFENSLLKFLFGADGKSVFRGGYSIAYTREGINNFRTFAGGSPGLTQSISLAPGDTGFTPGGLLLRNPLPAFREFPTSFSFPAAMSLFTFAGNNFRAYDPNIRTPYVQSWSLGIQRELTKDTVLEVRYVGNHGTKLWRSFNLNEVNIFENGFLAEFKNAQNNLAINRAAGVASFANMGRPGQVALPIFEALFGARGAMPALGATSGFASGTFITQLDQGQAGRMANSLAASATFLCRGVGNRLAACSDRGFNAPGPLAPNFFLVNPDGTGTPTAGTVEMLTNGSSSTYNGLQIEVKRRMVRGLMLNAHYTWSKSLTDLYADAADSYSNFHTLRNTGMNKGPSPWDIRHAFVANWSYEMPFGPGQRYTTGMRVIDKVIEGWQFLGILRIQSGRVFRLTSGRWTVNQYDSGVILKGMTVKELKKEFMVRKEPTSADIFLVSPKLIGADGRSNREILDVPTTPGEWGSFIYLTGPPFVKPDLTLIKKTRITERSNIEFWAEFFNAFNYQNFLVGGPAAAAVTQSIDSTAFGRTTEFFQDTGNQDPGSRMIQFRIRINF